MEPDRAVRELARVLHPGGTLVAFDNDWDTFRLRLDDQSLETRICRFWRDSFAAGRIGRALPELFQQCGLTGIHTKPCTLTLADGALAEKVFDIPVLLGRTVAAGILTPQESAKVQDELHRRSVDGTFLSGYTAFLVWGRKPV
jgi:SAM-dependent methyltransferase